MIYRTICSMDNITVEMDGDCRDLCYTICYIQNEWLECSKEDLIKFESDYILYGNAFMFIDEHKGTYIPANEVRVA